MRVLFNLEIPTVCGLWFSNIRQKLKGMESRWCFHTFSLFKGHTLEEKRGYEKRTAGCLNDIKEQDLGF
jgi:hypothetical protein